MIFITGDTHGHLDVNKLSLIGAKKGDYVIILGDFGAIWANEPNFQERNLLNWYKKQPYTTLFVDGNHENFDRLNAMPVTEWNGGKVHRINKKVFHLMRGQVFNIEGFTFFTFGGAYSIDKHLRIEGMSWWPQEIPNHAEVEEGLTNLEKHNYNVDYVLTHTCPSHLITKMVEGAEPETTNKILDNFNDLIEYRNWFFGHWHFDIYFKKPDNKFKCLYNDVIVLKGDEQTVIKTK